MNKSVVVLCSGGIDSVLAARLCEVNGDNINLLHVDYGQKTAEAETSAITACARYFGWNSPIMLSINQLSKYGTGSLITSNAGDNSFFPHRNFVLISLASLVASSFQARCIAIGTISGSDPEFKDCGTPFLKSVSQVLANDDPSLELITPVSPYNKAEVGALAAHMGIPFDLTFSCNVGPYSHCQRCRSCSDRSIGYSAFLEELKRQGDKGS